MTHVSPLATSPLPCKSYVYYITLYKFLVGLYTNKIIPIFFSYCMLIDLKTHKHKKH